MNATVPEGFVLKEKVAELSEMLLSKHPRMPVLLQEIHKAIKAQPEQVTLLSDQEIGQIVEGLKIQTQVEFTTAATKGGGKTSIVNKIKTLGVDAF